MTSSLMLHILAVTTSTRSMAISLPTMNFARKVQRHEVRHRNLGFFHSGGALRRDDGKKRVRSTHLRIIGIIPQVNVPIFIGEVDWGAARNVGA